MKPSMLGAALAYASVRKWSVFPCSPADKSPLTDNGFYDATTNEVQIRKWWPEDGSGPMIGVRTGMDSGVMTTDLDIKDDGTNGVENYKAKFGPLPLTLNAATPRGGTHL